MADRKGFTLLEVILALGLTTVTVTLMGMAIQVNLEVADKSQDEVAGAKLARALFQQIADDLANAVPYQPPAGSTSASGSGSTTSSSSPSSSAGGSSSAAGSTSASGSGSLEQFHIEFNDSGFGRGFRRRPGSADRDQPPAAADEGDAGRHGRRHATANVE